MKSSLKSDVVCGQNYVGSKVTVSTIAIVNKRL